MNWDVIQGKWDQLKGSVKQQWGELTDDELTQINGDRDKLAGKLQERYGWAKTEVDEKMNDFVRRNS
ncbi:CsbD family protein [Paracoccus sp. (in: a-proteobacteria)]|uniref:CsbD family protein n=1 Tax=Paracoccus sp. TaxID=267 RepID=UPI0026DEBB23|nr:CsbD family protein [Paracoccus sp. (in: a-proteobacteria)]MDO5369303.1 CsbD family protein [Paracoccus sp. (in: a-proteobacteria)]